MTVLVGASVLSEPCARLHQAATFLVMPRPDLVTAHQTAVSHRVRFPSALRDRIAADADRCGRSFEGQVLALLRRHYGEAVDIAPGPAAILALATASLADVPEIDLRSF